MMLFTTLFAVCTFIWSALAQQPQVIKPGRGGATYEYSNNPRYREGSMIQFQWTSGIDNIRLVLYQEWPVEKVGSNWYDVLMENGGKLTTYDWKAKFLNTKSAKDGEDAVLYFDIMDANDTSRRIDSSSYFNVTRAEQAKSSSTSSTSTATAAETASSETSAAASNSGGDDGLSRGAVAGIAVGATLGGIFVLGGLGFWLGKKFARRDHPADGGSVQSPQVETTQPIAELASPKAELPVQERDYSQHQHYKYSQAVPPVVHEAP